MLVASKEYCSNLNISPCTLGLPYSADSLGTPDILLVFNLVKPQMEEPCVQTNATQIHAYTSLPIRELLLETMGWVSLIHVERFWQMCEWEFLDLISFLVRGQMVVTRATPPMLSLFLWNFVLEGWLLFASMFYFVQLLTWFCCFTYRVLMWIRGYHTGDIMETDWWRVGTCSGWDLTSGLTTPQRQTWFDCAMFVSEIAKPNLIWPYGLPWMIQWVKWEVGASITTMPNQENLFTLDSAPLLGCQRLLILAMFR